MSMDIEDFFAHNSEPPMWVEDTVKGHHVMRVAPAPPLLPRGTGGWAVLDCGGVKWRFPEEWGDLDIVMLLRPAEDGHWELRFCQVVEPTKSPL